jgi:hypothetical protein
MGEERDTLYGARRHRHTPDLLLREPTIPLPTLRHDAVELLKASLNVVVAEERVLDGPEGLTPYSSLQNGLYTYPCQDGRTFSKHPGVVTPATPPPYQHLDEVPRIHLSASLCERATYSGRL